MDPVQSHAEWVGAKVAEAKEQGIRLGLDKTTAAQIIAGLYSECEEIDTQRRLLADRNVALSKRYDALIKMFCETDGIAEETVNDMIDRYIMEHEL